MQTTAGPGEATATKTNETKSTQQTAATETATETDAI